MRRFFVPPKNIKVSDVTITGTDVKHLRQVLRFSVGDKIVVCDGKGNEYRVKINQIDKSEVKGIILERITSPINKSQVALFQGIPRGTKMDLIVRQVTELGISKIVPLVTERTVIRLDKERAEKKVSRWQRIALEAAKQSQRITVPEVTAIQSWSEALKELERFRLILVPWEEEKERSIKQILSEAQEESIAIVIGPEGGFSTAEIRSLSNKGGRIVSLGKNILRTETAGLVALVLVLYECDFSRGASI